MRKKAHDRRIVKLTRRWDDKSAVRATLVQMAEGGDWMPASKQWQFIRTIGKGEDAVRWGDAGCRQLWQATILGRVYSLLYGTAYWQMADGWHVYGWDAELEMWDCARWDDYEEAG